MMLIPNACIQIQIIRECYWIPPPNHVRHCASSENYTSLDYMSAPALSYKTISD